MAFPSSGQIKFSDFYGKKLNVVVKCTGGEPPSRQNANYNGDGVVVGGFRGKSKQDQKFFWIHMVEIKPFINITGT